jgi:outer membrane receptor for ferrienterochelin and colicin
VQFKIEPSSSTIVKTYAGYDYTSLNYHIPQSDFDVNERNTDMGENNVYLNSVLKTNLNHGWGCFTGVSWSWFRNVVNGALLPNDRYVDQKSEVHLKTRFSNNFGGRNNFSIGIEDYIRNFHKSITLDGLQQMTKMNYNTIALFINNQFQLRSKIYLNASLRMENYIGNSGVYFMPRISLSYVPTSTFQLSMLYGRYSQVIGDQFDIYRDYITSQSFATHYILSMQYKCPKTTYRIEAYDKVYSHLPLYEDQKKLNFNGKGYSYGVDMFLENNSLIDRLTTTLSYSYNYSRRKYLEYTSYVQPQYATTHNFGLGLKYSIPQIKCIFGFSENISSGRPYTDPTLTGKLQKLTKPYLSTGINVSYLASPSVIVYTSITNIFNRHNIFNYQYKEILGTNGSYISQPVESSRDRFFYIGVYISLKKSHAYEISNF